MIYIYIYTYIYIYMPMYISIYYPSFPAKPPCCSCFQVDFPPSSGGKAFSRGFLHRLDVPTSGGR